MYHVTALTSKHYVESISDHFLVAEMVVLRHHYSPLRITMGKFREKIKSAMSMLQWLYRVIFLTGPAQKSSKYGTGRKGRKGGNTQK